MPSNTDALVMPITVTIAHACHLMSLSRSTLYRRQGTPNFPAILKEAYGNRSFLLYAEIVAWSQHLGRALS